MKKLITLLLIIFCLSSFGQVVTTKIVKVANSITTFNENLIKDIEILDVASKKIYLTLRAIPLNKSISTCVLDIDLKDISSSSTPLRSGNGLYINSLTQDSVKLGGILTEQTTIALNDKLLKILNSGKGSVFSQTGIQYTKIDTSQFTDSTLITKSYSKSTFVPYAGATKDVNLNSKSISTSGIKLNTTSPLSVTNPGEIGWNAHDRTMNIKTQNTTIQVSQEQTFPVKNITGATLTDGRLVRIVGYDTVNDYYYVDYSDNSSENTAYVDFMLSESITNGSVGLATKTGLVHGLNTTGGTSQNPIYLSTSGNYTATEPSYPAEIVVVGTYGRIDASNGDAFVDLNKSSQYEINKINNELELKGMQNPGICQKCPITENDIVINTTNLTLTIATIKNGQVISAANPIRFFTDGNGIIRKWEKTAPVTFAFTNTTGVWYFYFDNSGNPISTQTAWTDFSTIAAVYRMYWNASLSGSAKDVIEAAEYHINDISASDHMWKHNEGTKHLSGLDYVANAISSGTPNADGRNAVLSLTTGSLVDDNLVYTVTNAASGTTKFTQDLGVITAGSLNATNSGQFMVRTNDSGGLLNKLPATRFPFAWNSSTNRPQIISTTGVQTDVTNQYYFVYFVYALQDPRRGEAIKVVSATTDYATKALADASNWESLQSVYPTLRDNEIRLLYKLTFECRHSNPSPYAAGTKYSALRQVDDLRKLKITSTSIASGTVLASNVIVTPSGNISSSDAQSALSELDSEKQPTIAPGATDQFWRGDKTWQVPPYLPLAGGTLTGQLNGTTGQFSGALSTAKITSGCYDCVESAFFTDYKNSSFRILHPATNVTRFMNGYGTPWLDEKNTSVQIYIPVVVPEIQIANSSFGMKLSGAYTQILGYDGFKFQNTKIGREDMSINSNGDATFSSTVTAPNFILSSDRRLKTNIRPINTKVSPHWVNFEMKSDSTHRLRAGVIAQELEKTNPEFVYTDSKGMKSVAYIDLLCAKIAELEKRIKQLENEK